MDFLIKNGPPHLIYADEGLCVDKILLQYDGALEIQVGDVRRAPTRLSEGRPSLEHAEI